VHVQVTRFTHFGDDYMDTNSSDAERLVWREIDTAFKNRIITGAIINLPTSTSNLTNSSKMSEIVIEHVRSVMQKYENINTVFNGEFVVGDKRANKSIAWRNYERSRTSVLQEWYESSLF